MIQFHLGSIFDSKCDLLVIPCNTRGGISSRVCDALLDHKLRAPSKEVTANGISFVENISTLASASVIAYAASVDISHKMSTQKLVEDLCQRIQTYCHENSLRKVNIPLLGSGAGKLAPMESYSLLAQTFEADPLITLCIYTLTEEIYRTVNAQRQASPAAPPCKNPRVFISYTGVDQEHRKWVRELACRLRENGVDARIDMYHLRPGQDLHQWMTNEVIMADKVLLICDKYYAEKADTRKGGVGWETMIILGDMLTTQEQTKYIGIIREEGIDESLPVYVRSKYSLNWSDDDKMEQEFNDLLLYLFDCDIEPPIGPIPEFVKEKLKI